MAGLFGSGPQSNILNTVAGSYTAMLNAEKQKGQAAHKALGAFGEAISPKAIGMTNFKNDFKNADWSKPETYAQAGQQIMAFDPQAGLSMIDKGRSLAASMAPKDPVWEKIEVVNADGSTSISFQNMNTYVEGTTSISKSNAPIVNASATIDGKVYQGTRQGEAFTPFEQDTGKSVTPSTQATQDTFTGAQLRGNPKYEGMEFKDDVVYQVNSITNAISPVGKTGLEDPSQGTTLYQNAKTIAGPAAKPEDVIKSMEKLSGIAVDTSLSIKDITSVMGTFSKAVSTNVKKIEEADTVLDLTSGITSGTPIGKISNIATQMTKNLFGGSAVKAQAELDNFRNSDKFTTRVGNAVSNFLNGVHTAETVKGYQVLAAYVKQKETNKYNDIRANQANALSYAENLTEKQLDQLLGPVKGVMAAEGTEDDTYLINGEYWEVRNGIANKLFVNDLSKPFETTGQ